MTGAYVVRTWWRRVRSLWSPPTPDTGQRGEDLAADHLEHRGYRILARNLRRRHGEIDLIADPPDHRAWVIVEVKCSDRSHAGFPPHVRVHRGKQVKLATLAAGLLQQRALTGRPVRFDIISITLHDGGAPTIQHLPGAFESPV